MVTMAFPHVRTIFLQALNQLQCLHLPTGYIRNVRDIRTIKLSGVALQPLSILHRSPLPIYPHRGLHTSSPTGWRRTGACGLPDAGGKFRKPASAALNPRLREVMLKLEGNTERVLTKADAEALAKERNRYLVLRDANSQPHPTYELMTGKQLAAERLRLKELKRLAKKAAPKELQVTARIAPHDLETKTKKIVGWLQKGQHVKISIKLNAKMSEKPALDVFKYMADNTKDIATVGQSQKSASHLIYLLKPTNSEPDMATSNLKPYTNDELQQQALDSDEKPNDTPT